MPSLAPDQIVHAPRTVRLKTLIALRWFAVIGQAATVLVVHYWLEFELPLAACLSVIALCTTAARRGSRPARSR